MAGGLDHAWGKLEYGESFEDGSRREVAEETGIELEKAEVICINNDMNEHAHFITIGLYSEQFTGETDVLEPEEIAQWEWFELDDLPECIYFSLPERIYFPSAKILENHKKNNFTSNQENNQRHFTNIKIARSCYTDISRF